MTLAGFRQEKAIGAEYATSQLYAGEIVGHTCKDLGVSLNTKVCRHYGTLACLECNPHPPIDCVGDCMGCHEQCICRGGDMLGYRSISEAPSLVPGMAGVYLRRAWYKLTLHGCGARLFVDCGAVLRSPKSLVGDDVYIGPRSWLGQVIIGSDVMLSGPCYVTSGADTHGIERAPLIREQPVTIQTVRIGDDVWTGLNSVIMADLATGTVVGAGSVVTKPTEPYSIVAGNPARKIGERK